MNDPEHKVLFRVLNDDGTVDVETLWALKLGDDIYRLDNSPFYAYGVSWQDEVLAPCDDDEERATFAKVVTKSGNKTIRILFDEAAADGNRSQAILDALVEFGCSYEGANALLISVNVPPDVDFEHVRHYLIDTSVRFEHADPTYEELFPDDA